MNFSEIPSSLRKPGPYGEYNTRLAATGLPSGAQKMLLVGPLAAGGTLAAGVVAQAFSDRDVADFCGNGGVLHLMARAAYRSNPNVRLYVIGCADAGTKATYDLTLTGASITAPATLKTMIGNDSVSIDMAIGDTPAALVTKITAAINANTALPVTAVGGTGKTTLTFKHGGVIGNIVTSCSITAACGIIFAIAPVVVGAGDPSIATTLTLAAGTRWHVVATPYSDATKAGEIKSFVNSVSTALEQKPSIGVMAFVGTVSGAITLSGGVLSDRITVAMVKNTTSPAWEIAGAYAANIAELDDPAVPFNGMVLTGCAAPTPVNNLTRTEQETLLTGGITPLETTAAGELAIVRAVSTNNTGVSAQCPDLWIRILDYVRESVNTRLKDQFSQSKLNDRVVAAVEDCVFDTLKRLEIAEIVERVDLYKNRLEVVRDGNDPSRLNIRIPTDIVNGLQVMASSIELYL